MKDSTTKEHHRVQVNDTFVACHESPYNIDDLTRAWYTPAELKRFQYDAALTVLKAHLLQRQCCHVLAYNNVLLRIYLSCLDGKVPQRELFQILVHWNRLCPDRRGTERLSLRNILKAGNRESHSLISAVLALQRELVARGVPHERRSELIKECYKSKAQSDCVFARVKGIADSVSIKELLGEREPRVRLKGEP